MVPAIELFRQKYGTQINQEQIINWIWYDTLTYTSAATVLLTFFNAVRATKNLGNMELAGTLAHPKAFIIRAIRVVPLVPPASAQAAPFATSDVYLLMANAWAELTIGNKNYGTWPGLALPSGAGVWSDGAGAGAEANDEFVHTAGHGAPDPRAVYTLSQPLMIDPQINFTFTLQWAAAQALTGDKNIMVMLDGELLRPVQ